MWTIVFWGLIIIVFCIWVIGSLLTLKMDSMLCGNLTNYDVVGIITSLIIWPAIATLCLRTRHRTGRFTYSNGKVEVINERWRY